MTAIESRIDIVLGGPRTKEWLLTTAIGGNYYKNFEETVLAGWECYAQRYDIGIAVVRHNIQGKHQILLNGSWQKLLAPEALRQVLGRDVRCLVLDTDIHISPFAENIFRSVEPNKIGVVSQYSGLPMDYRKIRNRAAWFRKMFWDEGFPLSSMLTATPADCFRGARLENQYEELFCAGLFVVETSRHAQFLVDTYDSAPVGNPNYYAYSTWEELWLNFQVFEKQPIQWLNYTWHALWLYEMVMYFPFLYSAEASQELCHWCLATSLLRNNFVHLAGGWESQVFKGPSVADLYGPRGFNEWVRSLGAHDDTPLEGVSRGYIGGPE